MTDIPIIAVALSVVCMLILGLGDPKRRRSAGNVVGAHKTATRRLLATLACLPGVYLAATGDASAFLIWLGGCSVAGWLMTRALGILSRQQSN